MSGIEFQSLPGLQSYSEIRELQKKRVEQIYRGQAPSTVYFLEHHPVVTRGRGLQWAPEHSTRERHAPMGALPAGIEFSESERGGDLTYHGPGQLVVYPLLKLDGEGGIPKHDLEAFLRGLESILDPVFESVGLERERRANATGIWVGGKKVASIGVAVRRWVTYHGIAINCVNDLSPFHLISPCGFSPEVMTRLEDLSPRFSKEWKKEGWRPWLEAQIQNRLRELYG